MKRFWCSICVLACLWGATAHTSGAGAPCVEGDPMIKISSLPFDGDLKAIMASISADVSRDTGLPETFVTYYWQTFNEVYCPGCEGVGIKSVIFVDLYVPAFMTAEERKQVMISLATALDKHTPYTKEEVYIHTHIAEKDQLYIMGNIVTNWSQVGGPDDSVSAEEDENIRF